jgi:hypothetical protein
MRFIATVFHDHLQPVAPGGRRVADAHEDIRRYLADNLGEAHAAMLAEPALDPTRGRSSWYTEAPGELQRYVDAPDEVREAAYAKLTLRVQEIQAHARELQGSQSRGDQIFGHVLAGAAEIPDEQHIYVAGDEPVLLAWGFLRDDTDAPRGVLESLSPPRRVPGERATPDMATAPPVPGGVSEPEPGPSDAVVVERRWLLPRIDWVPLLLWLLLALLLAAIGVTLLTGCNLGTPGGNLGVRLGVIDRCPAPRVVGSDYAAPLQQASARTRQLQNRLDQLQLALLERDSACRAQPAEKDRASLAPGSLPDLRPPAAGGSRLAARYTGEAAGAPGRMSPASWAGTPADAHARLSPAQE